MNILVLNAGSSSQKSNLYCITGDSLPDDPPQPIWEGKISWSAPDGPESTVKIGDGTARTIKLQGQDKRAALRSLLETLWSGGGAPLSGPGDIQAVGHRVVHGGSEFTEPVRIDEAVKDAISRLAPLAPEHNPAAREGIDATQEIFGSDTPQIAVFDTAFHHTLPEAATLYPIPYEWTEKYSIRRYGFHGINHGWCAGRAAHFLGRDKATDLRLISCHLGNGASLAAIHSGKSIDTTMGFTPMEGLMMGSRSGTIDPGLLLYLLRQNISVDDMDHTLNSKSGLHGISGISEDMRAIREAIGKGDARATRAFDLYVQRLRRELGGMLTVLGGLDALIFTAGVGENSPEVRAAACDSLAFLGLHIDPAKNEAHSSAERDIAAADSAVRVLVIPAQEDWAIARDCWHLTQA